MEKKHKYLNTCLEQCRHQSPFVMSIDGMLGHEVSMILKQMLCKFGQKWDCPMSHASNNIITTMSLSLMQSTHHFLWRSRVPSSAMSTRQWPCEEDA
eukprot:12247959-Ditylum_brightwellii.AAC.1